MAGVVAAIGMSDILGMGLAAPLTAAALPCLLATKIVELFKCEKTSKIKIAAKSTIKNVNSSSRLLLFCTWMGREMLCDFQMKGGGWFGVRFACWGEIFPSPMARSKVLSAPARIPGWPAGSSLPATSPGPATRSGMSLPYRRCPPAWSTTARVGPLVWGCVRRGGVFLLCWWGLAACSSGKLRFKVLV